MNLDPSPLKEQNCRALKPRDLTIAAHSYSQNRRWSSFKFSTFWSLLLLLFPLVSLTSECSPIEFPDFDQAMGKGRSAWSCLRTIEDSQKLSLFRSLYESYQSSIKDSYATRVPKVLHWIWLGPKPFPTGSIARMKQWIKLHPGWAYQLWTDQQLFSLPEEVKICNPFLSLDRLADCFFNSDNFGEKSEILRLAILSSEGGIYIDHDLEPIKPLDPIADEFMFFCGLEILKETLLSSSVYPSTHLIGTSPKHPILEESIRWLMTNWERLEAQFPGSDQMAIANRVKHRGSRALEFGLLNSSTRERAIVFPSSFFSENHPQKGIYAAHYHLGSWLKKEEDEKVRHAFAKAEENLGLPAILVICLTLLNLMLAFYLFKTFQKRSVSDS